MTENVRDLSDSSLVVAISRWQHDALGELYRRHGGNVYGLARRLLQDGELAQDITQEVFLSLWNSPEKFNPERGTLHAFLATTTRSRSVDLIRSTDARRKREIRVSVADITDQNIDNEIMLEATTDEIRKAFDCLPQKEQQVLQVTFFDGFTYKQAAEILNEPEGTVKGRIRSGLKRLQTMLAGSEAG